MKNLARLMWYGGTITVRYGIMWVAGIPLLVFLETEWEPPDESTR
jgi:hypothetical protein